MIRSWWMFVWMLPALLWISGCGPHVKTYEVQVMSGVDQAKAILDRYAKGEPMGSEAATFSDLVENIRKTDPDKAAILEKGFADIQKASPQGRASIAKQLLEKL